MNTQKIATLYRLSGLILTCVMLLSGCAPPVYEETTYGLDDFMADSEQIAQGKYAIIKLEHHNTPNLGDLHEPNQECVIDGDELSIALHNPKRPDHSTAIRRINQTTGFRICDGRVTLPEIGSVEVQGLTIDQVRKKIQNIYLEQVSEGKVFVDYKMKRQRQVQIIGAKEPMVSVDEKTRLSEVLARADLPPSANLFKSKVIRQDQELPVDLYKLVHEGDETQNIVMCGGDQIFIAHDSDAAVIVTGEVLKPVVIPVPYGFISLREAIAISGSIPFTGDKGCIAVIRGDFIRPRVYCLNWKEMEHFTNQSLLLMPGDVVVISEKPLTQWNRFINQLQPSTKGMQAAYNIYWLYKHR